MSTRKYIPKDEKVAAALSLLLTEEERKQAREVPWTSAYILSLFEWHHVVPHAHGGSDTWENLHPMRVAEHDARTKVDVTEIAKSKRIAKKELDHKIAMLETIIENDQNHHIAPKQKRKISSRGFGHAQPRWKLQLAATRGGHKNRRDRSKP